MTSSIQALLDIVLPRKERLVRAEHYVAEDLPILPTEHEACGVSVTTLLSYRNPAVEDCIRAVKYDDSVHAAELLAEALSEYLREEIAQIHSFSSKPVLLVPVPLHPLRHHERGFNQIERVLARLPTEFHDGTLARLSTDALVRVRPTAQPTHLTRAERLLTMKGAFAVHHIDAVLYAHVILIDDVVTTGATLAEAVRPLLNLEVAVDAIALARA